MVRATAVACLLLAGCQRSPSLEDARSRYLIMLANHAPAADLCAEGRRNAQAALDAKNEAEYKYWLSAEKNACALPADAKT
jgi:hypothetical protein